MELEKRKLVEAVKAARYVTVVCNLGGERDRIVINPIADRKLAHDIALALQTYWIAQERAEERRRNEEALLRP